MIGKNKEFDPAKPEEYSGEFSPSNRPSQNKHDFSHYKVKAPNVAASRGQEKWRAPLYSLLILIAFVLFWQFISTPSVDGRTEGLPGPIAVIGKTVTELAHPFRNNGLNDQGIGFQMIASLTRVAYGYIMAAIVAILGGVALGLIADVVPSVQSVHPVAQAGFQSSGVDAAVSLYD